MHLPAFVYHTVQAEFEGLNWEELSARLPRVMDAVCAAVFPELVLVFIDSIDHCIDLHGFAWLFVIALHFVCVVR